MTGKLVSLSGLKMLVASFLSVVLFAGVAQAETLSVDEAKRFAQSIPDATALGEALRKEIGEKVFDDEGFEGDEFRPYSGSLMKLKTANLQAYKRVSAMAKTHGFADAANWASVGDRTMKAYIALKMPPGVAQMASSLSPQMLAMMPEETKAQYAKSQKLMKVLSEVSDADKAAVAEVSSVIDAAIGAAGYNSGVFEAMQGAMGR